jgi:hypothetical protein
MEPADTPSTYLAAEPMGPTEEPCAQVGHSATDVAEYCSPRDAGVTGPASVEVARQGTETARGRQLSVEGVGSLCELKLQPEKR